MNYLFISHLIPNICIVLHTLTKHFIHASFNLYIQCLDSRMYIYCVINIHSSTET